MKKGDLAKGAGLIVAGAVAGGLYVADITVSKDVLNEAVPNAVTVKDSLRTQHWSTSKRFVPRVVDNDTTYEEVIDSALVESKFNPFNGRWANRGKFNEGDRILLNVTEFRTSDTTTYGLDFTFAKDGASYILKVDEVQ